MAGRAWTAVLAALALAALTLAGALSGGARPAPERRLHAPNQSADLQNSTNWAGYAVSGEDPLTGEPISYRAVSGAWTQPRLTCRPGEATYSAFWIGLGGFAGQADALEQVGTSAECSPSGRAVHYVWYELIPEPSVRTRLKVAPGDRLAAVVVVDGTAVTMRIRNLTRRTIFTKRATVAEPDVSSAEWVAEAPSGCSSLGRCHILPLADFGTVTFTGASAVTTAGASGHVLGPWTETQIQLAPEIVPIATPSALTADGSSFAVTMHPDRVK
jgi:hypothetical protein